MNPSELKQIAEQVQAFLKNDARRIIRIEGVKHFKDSFVNEGFTDETLIKWPDISEKRKAQKRKANGSITGILYDKGLLKNNLTGTEDADGVTFSSDRDYAERHNEGLAGMPKRQFMGPSKQLDQKIISKFEQKLDKFFNR